ncbi:MAG: flagellar motor protein MotB [Pseudomonadota bacterium]
MSAQSNAPTIIKRKKVIQGGGHHGGAWKVAYADFVTAMMAFFMLMWLLGATTEKQRKGIADYFNPTIPVVRSSAGGQGAFGGDSVYSENTLAQNGTGAGLARPTEARQARGDTGQTQPDAASGEDNALVSEDALKDIERRLLAAAGESMFSELLRRHVVTRISDEGLVVELFDTEETRLFDARGEPAPELRSLMDQILPVFSVVTNQVAIRGHVRAEPVVLREGTSWSRSSARADTVRKLMQANADYRTRILRVAGYADRAPTSTNPMAVRNDRVEIVLLRSGV